MRSLAIGVVLLSIACGRIVSAQVPTDSSARIAELEQQVARYLRLLGDWGGLTRYGSADAELGPAKPGDQRVVFIGDDITEAWSASGRFFPASRTSIAASPGRRRRRCWCGSGRTSSRSSRRLS